MPYIFHSNQHFTLIDSTPKNGVFCQTFTSGYSPKLIQIHPQYTTDYSAHMDSKGKIYVATMPDAFHLNYFTQEGNRFAKNTLIANKNSNYMLTSPIIYTLQDTPFIIYLSHQNHTETYSFIQDNLYQPQLTTLLSCHNPPTLIKYYSTNTQIWIFFITFDEMYHLNALCITPTHTTSTVYLNSPEPIVDYSVCIDSETLHVTYVSELHGKFQLCYFNTDSAQITDLITTQTPSNPVVFCYYNMIWINAIINHRLQMMISIDHGRTFSISTPCSIQNNIHRTFFLTHQISSFIAQEVYAYIASNIKLCTLAMIDIPRFHMDSTIAPELELLLEGLLLTIDTQSTSNTSIEREPIPSSTSSTPSSSSMPPSTPTLDEAKNAFMNDLAGWELPPRI